MVYCGRPRPAKLCGLRSARAISGHRGPAHGSPCAPPRQYQLARRFLVAWRRSGWSADLVRALRGRLADSRCWRAGKGRFTNGVVADVTAQVLSVQAMPPILKLSAAKRLLDTLLRWACPFG